MLLVKSHTFVGLFGIKACTVTITRKIFFCNLFLNITLYHQMRKPQLFSIQREIVDLYFSHIFTYNLRVIGLICFCFIGFEKNG